MPKITLIQDDCLKAMRDIPSESINMVLCDLPYGTTASNWDKIINFKSLWQEYERVIDKSGAIVLFSSGQFTMKLINSNPNLYRYKWIWLKNKKGNFVNANNRPMTSYEEICIFSKGTTANGSTTQMRYFPQGIVEINKIKKCGATKFGTVAGKRPSHTEVVTQRYTNYPIDVLSFDCVAKPVHPTQKPTDLLEYLIKTYTEDGQTILDNCMGSGSTGVACLNTDRNFIGIELDSNYYNIARNRLYNQGEI